MAEAPAPGSSLFGAWLANDRSLYHLRAGLERHPGPEKQPYAAPRAYRALLQPQVRTEILDNLKHGIREPSYPSALYYAHVRGLW